jgi:hypothetical protein
VPVATALRRVAATRYATALREGGSLPGLVEADDDGLYVVKFTGAGQGARALVAEVVVGELARALGLPVPELVVVGVDPELARAEPDAEIRDLVSASPGPNLGVDFLPGALPFLASGFRPDADLAADVVWLDALTTNVDRTPQNPNLLLWHDRMWLIDHGSALFLQRGGIDPAGHVLLPYAGSIAHADERLAPRVDRPLLEALVALVPEQWLSDRWPVEYLERRLAEPRGFVEEAERARPS